MKNIYLIGLAIIISFSLGAQSMVKGISPAPITHCFEHTYSLSWPFTPNLGLPGTFVQDTLAFVDDGVPGLSADPNMHPLSAEGCNPLINSSVLTGKIAVVYRGTCEFGVKALNAQNAGAVGVIIIDRDSFPVQIAAGSVGHLVTIPIVVLGVADGDFIANQMNSGPVVMYLGHNGYNGSPITTSQSSCFSNGTGSATAQGQAGTPPYSYLWNNGATTSSITNVASGTYTVTVSDALNCKSTDSVVISSLAPFQPNILSSLPYIPCPNGSLTLSTTNTYNAYSWSNGSTSASNVISTIGWQSVVVTNSLGCLSLADSIYLGSSPFSAPQICLVSTDSLFTTNSVIWEKPLTSGIDSFYVYRENSPNNYIQIGALSYTDTAIFQDNQINPALSAHRYKISSIDSCGGETAQSGHHRTIHMTSTQGPNFSQNLSWSPYEGLNFATYTILRGTSPGNMTAIASLPSTSNSYIDSTAPTFVSLYYQIEVFLPVACDPLKSQNYGLVRSNLAVSEYLDLSEHGIQNSIQLFPNPVVSLLTVKIPDEETQVAIRVLDATGKVLESTVATGTEYFLDTRNFSKGVYFIHMTGERTNAKAKVFKN